MKAGTPICVYNVVGLERCSLVLVTRRDAAVKGKGMGLFASLQALTTGWQNPGTLMTLSVALLFAAIYVLGGRAHQVFGERGLRRFHSLCGGIAVSYVFVYIMPELHAIREVHVQSQHDYIRRIFPEYSVYLSALVGFLIFYGLESAVASRDSHPQTGGARHGNAAGWRPWIHIGGFALYTWLIAYLMVKTGGGPVRLGLFAMAMGMHLAPIANRLRKEYPAAYEHRGAVLLGVASVGGWAGGLTLSIPEAAVLDMMAIVAGGVIVNAAIAELPKERRASFWWFCAGAVAYAALLLALSRFEHGA
jgi:hypothetical protein